jgi:predicted permease
MRRFFRHEPSPEHVGDDVDAELRFHFENAVRDLMARGMDREDARREAERRFGDVERTRDRLVSIDRGTVYRRRRAEAWHALAQDVRYAARALRRSPVASVTVVITMALGIGANATMFGVIDRLMLRGPAAVADASRLRRVFITQVEPAVGRTTSAGAGYVLYTTLRDRARSLAGVAAYSYREWTLGRGTEARKIPIGAASWDLFPLLGVRPHLGRFFSPDEDRPPTGAKVAIVSYGFWQSELGGAADVLGRKIVLNYGELTIIGVAPAGFTGPQLTPAQVWVPMVLASTGVTNTWWTSWSAQWLELVARLKPGVTVQQAHDDLTAALRRAYTGKEKSMAAGEVSVAPLWYNDKGRPSAAVDVSRWILGVAVVVLVIACANVTNLLLARSATRRREIAVRLALGISRARLLRLLIAESIILIVGGALGALAVAYAGSEAMRRTLLIDVAWTDAPVDGRVLVFTAIVALGTGLLVGLAPAVRASNPDITHALMTGGRGGGVQRSRLRATLLVMQAALSLVLLVGAGLFVRSLGNIEHLDLGIEPDRVLTANLTWARDPNESFDARRARINDKLRGALAELARMPSIDHAAIAVGTPFFSGFGVDLRVPGWDSIPPLSGGGPFLSAVTSDYFATVGTRLMRGRAFLPNEGRGTEPVAMVNETMERTLWPRDGALGKCLMIDNAKTCSTIVGVVRDAIRFGLRESAAMQYYVPVGQETSIGGSIVLVRPRTDVDAAALTEPLRRVLLRAGPELRFIEVKSLQEKLDPQVRPWRLGAAMFGLFGVLALIVAMVGLYSVVSYLVAQRTHEFGVRIALGAGAGRVVGGVLAYAVRFAGAGVVMGAVLALVAGKWIAPLLFNESPRDPVVFVVVAAILLAVAVLASLTPAWRAARVDPVIALRAD